MAIDTVAKRDSSLLDDCGILFPPDGTISSTDRAWMVGQYSGISAAILIPVYPGLATLSGTGVDQATLSGTGVDQATLISIGPDQATLVGTGPDQSTFSSSGVQKSTFTKRTS